MNESLFWLVNVVIVAIATGAPVSNEGDMAPAASPAENAEDMIMVGKRAEEMVFFGNQQNGPRLPMKKSQPPIGEEDMGAKLVVHDEIPVEEDLNDRAETVRGESEIERLAEGMKVAEDKIEEAAASETDVKDKKEDVSDEQVITENAQENSEPDALAVDLPESVKNSQEIAENTANSVTDMEQSNNEQSNEVDSDDADEELASLSNEANSLAEENENDESSSTTDADVENFLDELRKESGDDEKDASPSEDVSNSLKGIKEASESSGVVDPNYYQTLYHILANTYRGDPAEDYYNYNMMMPSYYVRRRRRSSLRRRDLASIRSRRSGHVRRIKRDLPSDWLAAYEGLDIPYSKDSLLSESEDPYGLGEPANEELSRYIYANLLNKLFGGDLDIGVKEEVPLEEVIPYELGPEISDSLLEEYEPEENEYDPDFLKYYRENSYDDVIPAYEYRKRSGSGYYPDSRRKRYFYPAYEEPETHWGAFVPEKRSNYDDALQRLQRLALALSDNPRPYYESLLGEYKKK